MAGDWIPMRTNLEDDPTVAYIARVLRLQSDHVVGKLHRFWSWADSHAVDGRIEGIGMDWIDQKVGKRGFANAMAVAPYPWLSIDADGVSIVNFEHWFGASAKRRLMDTRRKQSVRTMSAVCPQDERTKTGLQNRTVEKRLIAPALGGAEMEVAKAKARTIAEKLGACGTARNKRLLLGACALSEELGEEWLSTAVRETREAHAEKPYAYLNAVLTKTAERLGVDFQSSISALQFPEQVTTDVLVKTQNSVGGGGDC